MSEQGSSHDPSATAPAAHAWALSFAAPALVATPKGAVLLEPDGGEQSPAGAGGAARPSGTRGTGAGTGTGAAGPSGAGTVRALTRREAVEAIRTRPVIVAHAPATARRLRTQPFPALDILELFAFVRPAQFCVPTPRGVAKALGIAAGEGHAGEPHSFETGALLAAARQLLAEAVDAAEDDPELAELARLMAAGGWPWGRPLLAALGLSPEAAKGGIAPLAVWRRLPEWAEEAPEPPAGHFPVTEAESRERLAELLNGAPFGAAHPENTSSPSSGLTGGSARRSTLHEAPGAMDARVNPPIKSGDGHDETRESGAVDARIESGHDGVKASGARAEARPEQAEYAAALSFAFTPREEPGMPQMILAEAGTGTGKTLGYVAPASVWAEKNRGAVWISTFTRNLQRQIDQELSRLYPDPVAKAHKAVVRKGRENYLCLLNLEDAATRAGLDPREGAALGLMARWAGASRDGDMVGGDFPAWLTELLGAARTLALADRRGECIYAACPHYHKCFIERTVRRARRAEIVVANHALVMAQSALSGLDDAFVPTRFVFDEGHHLFSAADSAFSAHLTGRETAELRRWLAGAEDRRRSRARGLSRRIGDLCALDGEAEEALVEVAHAAQKLPGAGWLTRLADGTAKGPAEVFLARLRQQVLARAREAEAGYSLETEARPLAEGVLEAAANLDYALRDIAAPLSRIQKRLARMLSDRADELDAGMRLRIEGAVRSIEHRAGGPLAAWRAMLAALSEETPDDFVDWFGIERAWGREADVGMHRHWVDPTRPLAETVYAEAHGVVVTSATLTDATGDEAADWASAEARTGAVHLPRPVERAAFASPFDYAAQARVYIVTDVDKADAEAVAAAYRTLFLAAGGGALGLFTSIQRLRAVHERIAPALDDAGLPLYAQHVDAMDTPTLVDIFREDEDACLLGTDAVRDGVDVPGRSLRLIVFDRTPWPRPDILHKARKARFGGKAYDEMLVRLRLKQAFGRLIRRREDHGCFVLLDRALPSRFQRAFPDGVTVARVGIKEAAAEVRGFLGS